MFYCCITATMRRIWLHVVLVFGDDVVKFLRDYPLTLTLKMIGKGFVLFKINSSPRHQLPFS